MSHPEKILCIHSDKLFKNGKWNGLMIKDLDSYLEILNTQSEFRVRDELETDSSYKQIIAQVVLRYKDKYYLHKQVNRTETRLNGLCPLPLGGHIEEFDKGVEDIFEVALLRELHEEVELKSNIVKQQFLGLLYIEDENFVNHTHMGVFYIFDLDGTDVHIKEEGLEDVGFVSLEYLKTNKETLTYWSRVLIYHL